MTKRVFLAIDLTEETKGELSKIVAKLRRFSPRGVRFIPPENWHLTLIFFGDKTEDEIGKIRRLIRDKIQAFPQREASLISITYGPDDQKPRMIWANADAETSKKIGEFNDKLSETIREKGINPKNENRNFNGHITLARVPDFMPKSKLPPVELSLNLKFRAESITLFESKLNPSGAEYFVIEDYGFKPN